MIIGYARVSTAEQKTELQTSELKAAGCELIFKEKMSGASRNRPELKKCLDSLREGDTLMVW